MIPMGEIVLRDGDAWIHFANPQRVIVAEQLQDVLPALREIEDAVNTNGLCAAGFLSYESAPAFDEAHQTHASSGFPLLWFGLYPQPRFISLPEPASPKPALTWSPTVDRATYNSAIDSVRARIAEGRTYQVNYTMRLKTEFNADAWNFFLHLAQGQNNHAAYVDTGRFAIASASPELFFQLDGETVTCRPMKGTTRRGRTNAEDAKQAEWLKESEKNRAENVMIVDMIRNDLGRIAKTGSVHAPELFAVEKYPTLWQMTSTVKAQTDASLTKIFSALFPCASITGAPKVSTMRIISELETTPRKIYTGSIGYIAPNRKAKFNVAIRTALIDRETQTAEYGVGGGIVWDSTSADEYEEALLKARVLTESPPQFSLLETMLWTPEDGFFLRDKHIARLLDSAEYFDFPISNKQRWSSSREAAYRDHSAASKYMEAKEIVENYLHQLTAEFTSPQRVRLLLDKQGNITAEHTPFQSADNPLRVRLADNPINSNDVFLFHKTTHRKMFDDARENFPDYDDILLFNERGELTEFTIGNLVVELDGKFFTPPISCGLLAGTFREYLLETGKVEERFIHKDELKNCTEIYLINSVRKWQEVDFKFT
ncbi:MAG: aminodeoxychorismate synthase component I [Anaerolineales bacterium]|nr:MAG: aminodeoxychorismate synthase component I [Anaerolineales bacterium]